MKACLGIDTSCYTTSLALCRMEESSAADGVFFQERKLLTVPEGGRGLMQSEMVFQHMTRLPGLLKTLLENHPEMEIAAVCASVRPRPDINSYMPAFRAGESAARMLAAALIVPMHETTHQAGHLRAARVGTSLDADRPSVALHLSGGTTELLVACGEDIRRIGGTLDISAGQLIDRVGVALGLPFPAGPHLEALARQGKDAARLTSALRGCDCHLSGAEAQAMRLIEEGTLSKEDIAAEVFAVVARTVSRLVVEGAKETGLSDALLCGGVMASSLLKDDIIARIAGRNRTLRLHFGRPELSGDNAVGTALIGAENVLQRRQSSGS